jgi:class 3 adenylate cyclase
MIRCTACGEENSERARFCQACGSPLEAPSGTRQERRVVSVLFVDLVGFTSKSEQLDPEDVRSFLTVYYERARAEIERFGGRVEKFIGDAVMAVFGAPVAYGDDPERAVRAAMAVRDSIAEMDQADPLLVLQVRAAVNTGEAIVELSARPDAGVAMVAGDVVNTAARLQSNAPVNEVLVGEETYASTRTVIEYRPVEPIVAKGKTDPVQAWVAVAPLVEAGERVFSEVPLVGRGEELANLRSLWDMVSSEHRCSLVTVFGPAGIGKSRLAHELAHRATDTGGLAIRGRAAGYGDAGPYSAFAQHVAQIAGACTSRRGCSSRRSRASSRRCWCSKTSTSPTRACSIWSSSSRRGCRTSRCYWLRRRDRSCSPRARRGAGVCSPRARSRWDHSTTTMRSS